MYYELIVLWNTGEKEKAEYSTPEKAKEIQAGYLKAFGNQVVWTAINQRRGTIKEGR